MVAERPPEVEGVVVRIDEEVRAAGALEVIEGGDRGGDQRARAQGSARAADDHTEPIVLAEALEQIGQPGLPAGHRDLERLAAQLPRRMHSFGPLDRSGSLVIYHARQ
jgi:hypothetical protein